MEAPIYHLDKVIKAKQEDMEDFDGPLDLILHLLSKNKIEIRDIQITQLLDQYLEWMERREELNLEVASEFVTMAAHLVYIKTRMLLSINDEEAASEMELLMAALEQHQHHESYLKIKQLTERLGPMSEFGRNVITRNPEPMERGKIYEYDQEPGDLIIAMQEVMDRQGAAAMPPIQDFAEIVKREPYSVETKAREILSRLKNGGITRFLLLFRGSKSRSELVATFMAVLELCRSRMIRLAGPSADCTVTWESDEPENEVRT